MMTFRRYLTEAQRRYDYTSTHINLPDDLAASVIGWGHEHIPDDDLYKDPEEPGYGRENEPHITILYGIIETNPKKVRLALGDQKPFVARLGEVNSFTSDNFDVVKIEVKGKPLIDLNKFCCDQFDYKNNYPIYIPHVTVAYVRKGRAKKHHGDDFFKGREVPVREIIFSGKTGDKVRIPLGGRAHS